MILFFDFFQTSLKRSSVIASASTGIAALLLVGGATVHRQFFVPNDVTDDTKPNIGCETKKAAFLRELDLIIIEVFLFFYFPFMTHFLGS